MIISPFLNAKEAAF